MKTLKYTAILDEKRLLEYLNKIAPNQRDASIELLNKIMYYSLLSLCLPTFTPENHLLVATTLASNNPDTVYAWVTEQSEDIQQAITEMFERLFFSLEAHI